MASRPRIEAPPAFDFLDKIETLLEVVEETTYSPWEGQSRVRIQPRDPVEWPVLATALALDLPIWTEARDFFGCGIATWVTRTVEVYLQDADSNDEPSA